MSKLLPKAALLVMGLALAACGAPSETQVSAINETVASADAGSILIARKTGFGGSFVPINIFVDGERVSSVANNAIATVPVAPGRRQLEVRLAGPGGLTTTPSSISFVKSADEPAYFNISMRAGLIGSSLQIAQVAENSLSN